MYFIQAIAVHIAHKRLIPSLVGVTVIDVVEGTALDALASMQSFLRSRPTHFKSIQQAIEWSVRSGQIRNLDSARVSMPGQITNLTTNKLSTNELPLEESETKEADSSSNSTFTNPLSIKEDEELEPAPMQPPAAVKNYTWRIVSWKSLKFLKRY